jgi:hypothetical protein
VVGWPAFTCAFAGHVVTDYLACSGPKQAMMAGIVPGDATDDSLFMHPLAGTGVELDATAVTATKNATGIKIALIVVSL